MAEHGAAQLAPAPEVRAPEWTAPEHGAVQVAVAPGVQAPESAVIVDWDTFKRQVADLESQTATEPSNVHYGYAVDANGNAVAAERCVMGDWDDKEREMLTKAGLDPETVPKCIKLITK